MGTAQADPAAGPSRDCDKEGRQLGMPGMLPEEPSEPRWVRCCFHPSDFSCERPDDC